MKSGNFKWNFPKNEGGTSYGFNDSSQEFFRTNITKHTMREAIQNSMDARDPRRQDKPVVIEIKSISVDGYLIGASEIRGHIYEALKRSKQDKQENGIKFFENALDILKNDKILTLAIIDKNTTGLTDHNWRTLVHTEGIPHKDGMSAAGGSFGIGKNAPYLASKLKMVCYSTRYSNKHRIEKFIGRCKLVTHKDPKANFELQPDGFGTNTRELIDNKYPPIMGTDISNVFRLNENGTGVFIIGFSEDGWDVNAKRSIVRNFFAAIHEKKLIVNLDGDEITNEKLNDINFADVTRRFYYEVLKNPKNHTTIKGEFGKFELMMNSGDERMKNGVAYINRRGMMITDDKNFKKNPFHPQLGDSVRFVAVVRASDDKTDEKIRKMETPNHEYISIDNIDSKKRDKIKKQLKEIQSKITDYIRSQLESDLDKEQTNLTELSDILPFVSEPERGNVGGKSKQSSEIGHVEIPVKPPTGSSTASGDGCSGMGGKKGSANDSDGGRGNENRIKSGKSDMERTRIIRNGDLLKVAFTPLKTGKVVFALKPAGEQEMPEDIIKIGSGEGADIRNNTVKIDVKKKKRMIVELKTAHGMSYTGYEIVEYDDG